MTFAPLKEETAERPEESERVVQILTEAAQIFARKGYEGASMRDIAEACDISKSLLYHHFRSKEEIYSRVAVGATQELYLFVLERVPKEHRRRRRSARSWSRPPSISAAIAGPGSPRRPHSGTIPRGIARRSA